MFYFQHANEDVEKMILGNKCDMDSKRQVSKERGDVVSIIVQKCLINYVKHSLWLFGLKLIAEKLVQQEVLVNLLWQYNATSGIDPGLDINVCPIVRYQWKLTSDKQILYYGCPMGQVKKSQIPKRAGTTDKSISTSIKYGVCCIKEHCLISNLSIIYFD